MMDVQGLSERVRQELRQISADLECRHRDEMEFYSKTKDTLALIENLLGSAHPNSGILTTSKLVAIANGKRLDESQFKNLDEEQYDIVLNLTKPSLRRRINPSKRTPLEFVDFEKLGSTRLGNLAFFLEHPGNPIHRDNFGLLYGSIHEYRDPSTLRRIITDWREILGQKRKDGPYLISIPAWELASNIHSKAYIMNRDYRYLVIRYGKQ
jgi:hypothetical protein